MIDLAQRILLGSVLIVLCVCILFVLIRAIRGPRLTDRILCSNMVGTIVIMMISILSIQIKEGYLMDVCILYAMMSFVGVVVLYKVYASKNAVIDVHTVTPVNHDDEGGNV